MTTGSDGVSFLFPQDFFSQHRLKQMERTVSLIMHNHKKHFIVNAENRVQKLVLKSKNIRNHFKGRIFDSWTVSSPRPDLK